MTIIRKCLLKISLFHTLARIDPDSLIRSPLSFHNPPERDMDMNSVEQGT
jgi:hypothetical protein